MEYKVAGTDDNYVTDHDHSSEWYIFVFVDDGCNDIRSTGTSVIIESDAQAHTAHGCSDNTSHEILSGSKQ